MTEQVPEVFSYEGAHVLTCSMPLSKYLALTGNTRMFAGNCSALWRGYRGTWEIRDGRLYLTHLSGQLQNGEVADLNTLFGGHDHPVFADWYSGALIIFRGAELDFVHDDHARIVENDLIVEIDHGEVSRTCTGSGSIELLSVLDDWSLGGGLPLP